MCNKFFRSYTEGWLYNPIYIYIYGLMDYLKYDLMLSLKCNNTEMCVSVPE